MWGVIRIRLEASPKNLRGLSHREWGDSTETMSLLMETVNLMHGPSTGRPRWTCS